MSSAGTPPALQRLGDIAGHRRHLAVALGGAEGDQPFIDLPRLPLVRRVLRRRGRRRQQNRQPNDDRSHPVPPLRSCPTHSSPESSSACQITTPPTIARTSTTRPITLLAGPGQPALPGLLTGDRPAGHVELRVAVADQPQVEGVAANHRRIGCAGVAIVMHDARPQPGLGAPPARAVERDLDIGADRGAAAARAGLAIGFELRRQAGRRRRRERGGEGDDVPEHGGTPASAPVTPGAVRNAANPR